MSLKIACHVGDRERVVRIDKKPKHMRDEWETSTYMYVCVVQVQRFSSITAFA